MNKYWTPEIAEGVNAVGVRDPHRRLFDALIPLPQGTTYNCYLVKGSEGTALIDTVNPGFEKELLAKVDSLSVGEVDYVVMNHAEPDHAGAIPEVMERYPEARLVAGRQGAVLAKRYFGVSDERIIIVSDGERLALGGKTLRFLETPMLHWPETIMTYLIEDRVLFSGDFFGTHTATGLFASQVPEVIPFAQRYFGEIMMPFRSAGKSALKKVEDLEVSKIAPSHGPMYADPEIILEPYRKWTSGETVEKILIVYVSMWGSTARMAEYLADRLYSHGIEVALHEMSSADLGDIARDLVDSRGIVLGSPTVLRGMHPLGTHAANLVAALRPPAEYAAFIGSHGWSGGALKQAQEMLDPTGIEIVGAVDVQGPATEEVLGEIEALAHRLLQKL